ncbi:hypothetical protein SLA2020_029760 [Shorea laevis]
MIKTRTVAGVHTPENRANKCTQEELMMMETQDIGYILQKLQIEKLTAMLHSLDNLPSNGHIYYTESRKTAASHRELEDRKCRASELEKLFMEMVLKRELQKNCQKHKLHEHQIISPTSRPVYMWQSEGKQ